ncbi:unnamed protein product [Thelazia callipaeda]|uniref:Peptidase S72 domain-containing protein n=1 Tax=Thelazia callipaeda TaxID=103827 RepID=A0A0N5D1V4_THECL|nr:unnamed protein product [Thelazia callipaeda]
MGFLKFYLLPLLICTVRAVALIPELIDLFVGQPFYYAFQTSSNVVSVQDASGEELPTWLIWRKNEQVLEGVPQPVHIGKTFLRITSDEISDVVEISVSEEIKNPCNERNTLWIEIVFNTSLNSLSIADQLHLVDILSNFFSVNSSLLRVYSNKYKEEIRTTEIVKSGMHYKPVDDSTVIIWKVSCEEVDEDAINILEKVLTFDGSKAVTESQQKFMGWEIIPYLQLTKGILLPRKQRNHIAGADIMSYISEFATNEPFVLLDSTSIMTTTRSSRSTKKIDKPPVRLHSLQTFICKRGMMCEYIVPVGTFIDAEDGNTRSLSLSVFPIAADNNWLTLSKKNKQVLHGISLRTGDYEFRLEARDSANQLCANGFSFWQMTSAPFRVTVIPEPSTNHFFILDVDHSSERLTKDPDVICAFAEKLANSLGDRYPKNLIFRKIEPVDGVRRRTRVTFSNASLPYKYCQKKAIDAIKHIMLTRKRDRIRAEFVRAMDSRFPVRSVKLELEGPCVEHYSTSYLAGIDIPSSTTSLPPDYNDSPAYLWLPVALIAFLIFFSATLVLFCCLVRRKKKKTVQSEYMSKGLPVVFPEEIPYEDETAAVSTPMLVKEERPPLIISQHENPLYKPPPPLSAASSPRPRNAYTNQRQPPPYIPP